MRGIEMSLTELAGIIQYVGWRSLGFGKACILVPVGVVSRPIVPVCTAVVFVK